MKGIIADFLGIFIGCVCGDLFFSRQKLSNTFSALCGIIISMMSIVGFVTSMISVDGNSLESPHLMLAVVSLIAGTLIGEVLGLETKLYNSKILEKAPDGSAFISALINGTVMFAVGGMAIVGPLEAFLKGDNSTLYLKAIIDFTISLSLGGALGKSVAFSAFPVTVLQLLFGLSGFVLSGLFTADVVDSLCCVGYVILFFSGFNFLFENVVKVKTVNMLPAIGLVIMYKTGLYLLNMIGVAI